MDLYCPPMRAGPMLLAGFIDAPEMGLPETTRDAQPRVIISLGSFFFLSLVSEVKQKI
uniref:Uncharacterized protein n=1 Tax=Arundo donax TaxID=35708 RepID=A0A0A9DNL2_ARUDO